jgi:hypothetical protein
MRQAPAPLKHVALYLLFFRCGAPNLKVYPSGGVSTIKLLRFSGEIVTEGLILILPEVMGIQNNFFKDENKARFVQNYLFAVFSNIHKFYAIPITYYRFLLDTS